MVAQPPGDIAEALKVAEDGAHLLHPALQALEHLGALRRRVADADLVEAVAGGVKHLALDRAVKGVHLGGGSRAGAGPGAGWVRELGN